MSNFRRRLMMSIKKDDKYTVLDYLMSTGTQYIDTEYIGKTGIRVKLKFMQDKRGSQANYILASYINTENTNRIYAPYLKTDGKVVVAQGKYYEADFTTQLNEVYEVEIELYSNIITCNVNGENVFSKEGNFDVDGEDTLYLFSRHLTSRYSPDNFIGKIYYCKIWDNGNLVRDFIPVLDENDVSCLYDKVENKFYYNKGTGEFLY